MIRDKKAYTLIEILIVITIFAIVASFILLSVSRLGENHALQQAADQLAQRLEFARDEAILRTHSIAFQKTSNGYQFFESTNHQWHAIAHGPLAASQALPNTITLSSLHTDQPRIVFTPSDNVIDTTLILRAHKEKIQIEQDTLGHFQVLSAQ